MRSLTRHLSELTSNQPLWVFLHIPKSAGWSVRAVVEHNVPEDRRVKIYSQRNLGTEAYLANVSKKLKRADIVYGHIPAIVHRHTRRQCKYITILRDPVERVLSVYKYAKYDFAEHPLHGLLNEISLAEWLNRKPPITCNVASKLLSGQELTERNEVNPTQLDAAKTLLKQMPVFGIQDRFKESEERICDTLGWERLSSVRNQSSMSNVEFMDSEKITSATIEKIRSMNEADIALFEFGQRLFACCK